MKKLLSTMLCIMLLTTLFVPNISAAYKATGDYVLEVEKFDTSHTNSNEKASDGKLFWHWGISPTGNETSYVITMPVTVAEEGTYSTEFAVTSAGGSAFKSTVTVAVDGTVIGDSAAVSPDKIVAMNADFSVYKYAGINVDLTKGEHTVTLSVSKTKDGYFKFAADYVSLTKVVEEDNRVHISNPETSTGKFADYSTKYITGSYKDIEGNTIVGTGWGAGGEDYIIEIPLYAEKSGVYTVDYVISSKPSGAWLSDMNVYLDDTLLGTNVTTEGEVVYETTDGTTKYAMRKYTALDLQIEEGDHILTLEVKQAPDKVVKFAADYVTFTRALPPMEVDIQEANWNETEGKLETKVYVANNAYAEGDLNVLLMVAQYNERGTMLAITKQAVALTQGNDEVVTLTLDIAEGAVKTKVFAWSGTGFGDAGDNAYVNSKSFVR